MDAVSALGELATALAGGGLAALVALRAESRRHRGDVVRTDVDRGLDTLAALRAAYRACAYGAPAAELELARLEDALDLAARRVSARAGQVARRYVAVGRLYAAGDPAHGDVAETAAFDVAAATLIAARAG